MKITPYKNNKIMTKKTKEKIGRPTKLTPETKTLLKQAFGYDATIKEACLHAGIGDSTYHDWIRAEKAKNKGFSALEEEFDRLRSKPALTARKAIVDELSKNPEFSLKYMERKYKGEFSTRSEQTITDNREDESLDELRKINKNLIGRQTPVKKETER